MVSSITFKEFRYEEFAGSENQWTAKGAGGKEPRQKNVKNRQKVSKYFRHFSTFFAQGKTRQKSSKSVKLFLTLFDNFLVAPVFRPLLGDSERNWAWLEASGAEIPGKMRKKYMTPSLLRLPKMGQIAAKQGENQEWPRQTKPKIAQFMNFSQGRSGTKIQCESCLFSQGKTLEFTKMGEIHELFVLPLSLVWFAGATPEKNTLKIEFCRWDWGGEFCNVSAEASRASKGKKNSQGLAPKVLPNLWNSEEGLLRRAFFYYVQPSTESSCRNPEVQQILRTGFFGESF